MRLVLIGLMALFTLDFTFAPTAFIEQAWEVKVEEMREVQRALEHDLLVRSIMSAIREIESGGDYHAVGGSGEYGAYQFMPSTWHLYCIAHFGRVLNIRSEEDQDAVAYAKISSLLMKEHTPEQVASIWNSGRPDWRGRVGVNRYGIAYNVPRYVKKFRGVINNVN